MKTRGLVLFVFFILPQMAFAWGHRGHELVATIGAELTTDGHDFWDANRENMGLFTNVPDNTWKTGKSRNAERPTHWFEPDLYFDSANDFYLFPRNYSDAVAKFTRSSLEKSGTATWRVKQFYGLALDALKKGKFETALQMAGAMSHYVGDLSQPLHVTKNYDGQETGDKGIHKFFETTNINRFDNQKLIDDIRTAAKALLSDPLYTNQLKTDVVENEFLEVDRAYDVKEAVIQTDIYLKRGSQGAQAQIKIATMRLADGAVTLSHLLSLMWKEAGNPSSAGRVSVDKPEWVAPHYASVSNASGDDCE